MGLSNVVDNRSNEHNWHCDIVFEIFFDPDGHSSPLSFKNPKNPVTGNNFRADDHWTEWFGNSSVYSGTMRAIDIPANVVMYLYDTGVVETNPMLLEILHPLIRPEPMQTPYWMSSTRRPELT